MTWQAAAAMGAETFGSGFMSGLGSLSGGGGLDLSSSAKSGAEINFNGAFSVGSGASAGGQDARGAQSDMAEKFMPNQSLDAIGGTLKAVLPLITVILVFVLLSGVMGGKKTRRTKRGRK
jgi:hypothetical protein